MNRVSRSTEAQRLLFLESLARLGNVSAAAEFAELDRVALYRLRQRNPSFARAWAEAAEFGAAGLEDEAIRRAARAGSIRCSIRAPNAAACAGTRTVCSCSC